MRTIVAPVAASNSDQVEHRSNDVGHKGVEHGRNRNPCNRIGDRQHSGRSQRPGVAREVAFERVHMSGPELRVAGRPRCISQIVGHDVLLYNDPAGLGDPAEGSGYHRISCVSWMRLPQVSFSIAILDAVTSVGGMVNSAPRDFMRS